MQLLTLIGKVLAVAGATASILFAGLAMALTMGGTNWQSEADSHPLGGASGEFSLEAKPEQTGMTYKMNHRRTGAAAGGNAKVLADVVVAARKKLNDDLSKDKQLVDQELTAYRGRPEVELAIIEKCKAAADVREAEWMKQIDQLGKSLQSAADEFTTKANDLKELRQTGDERRAERDRAVNQLDLLRTDLFSTEQQLNDLQNEVVLLRELRRRMMSRAEELANAVGQTYDEATKKTINN